MIKMRKASGMQFPTYIDSLRPVFLERMHLDYWRVLHCLCARIQLPLNFWSHAFRSATDHLTLQPPSTLFNNFYWLFSYVNNIIFFSNRYLSNFQGEALVAQVCASFRSLWSPSSSVPASPSLLPSYVDCLTLPLIHNCLEDGWTAFS